VEYVGLLAPIAFVFAMSAYCQLSALRKEVESLKEEIAKLKVK
jgi:AmiR/NasT family two-component response regulator